MLALTIYLPSLSPFQKSLSFSSCLTRLLLSKHKKFCASSISQSFKGLTKLGIQAHPPPPPPPPKEIPHISYLCPFRDNQAVQIKDFLQVIQGKRVISNQDDVLLMKDVKGGLFLVKRFYLQLALVRDSLFPFRFVWNPWVPFRVDFFAWETS